MVRQKLKARGIVLGVFTAAVVVLILMFYIWHQVESIRLGYRVLELESELETLEQEIDTLEARRAGLLAPDRVSKIAREELGYIQVRDDQIVRREDRTIRRDRP
jgi:cell division protein FtsL